MLDLRTGHRLHALTRQGFPLGLDHGRRQGARTINGAPRCRLVRRTGAHVDDTTTLDWQALYVATRRQVRLLRAIRELRAN